MVILQLFQGVIGLLFLQEPWIKDPSSLDAFHLHCLLGDLSCLVHLLFSCFDFLYGRLNQGAESRVILQDREREVVQLQDLEGMSLVGIPESLAYHGPLADLPVDPVTAVYWRVGLSSGMRWVRIIDMQLPVSRKAVTT